MKKFTLALVLVTLILIPGESFGFGRKKDSSPTQSAIPPTPEAPLLSEAVKLRLTGLALEPKESQDRLLEQARAFITFKKRSSKKSGSFEDCDDDEDSKNPFCTLIEDSEEGHDTRAERTRRARRASQAGRIKKLLKSGKISELSSASERDLLFALGSVHDFKNIEKSVQAALEAKECPSKPLLSALGLKLEEFYPEEKFLTLSTSLYEHALDCGMDESTVKSAYRLGLILVWQAKSEKAESVLAKIMDHPEAADYRSRILYWRVFLAKQAGKEDQRKSLQDQLLKDYPLSFHALMLTGGASESAAQAELEKRFMSTHDTLVKFRSQQTDQINDVIRAVEALQALEAYDLASSVLRKWATRVRDTETGVQLYYAVLLNRSWETITKFQLMAKLFRENPDLISQSTLQLFYPLPQHEINAVRLANAVGAVDHLLVLSLIRQESAFNERARSRAGAMGLMQLMLGTARRMERVSRKDLYKPEINVRLGARYLNRLLSRYSGDASLALAAYNAGAERVDSWTSRYPIENRLLFVDLIPFRETREYVASIARNYYWYRRLYGTVDAPQADPSARQPATTQPFSRLGLISFSATEPMSQPSTNR